MYAIIISTYQKKLTKPWKMGPVTQDPRKQTCSFLIHFHSYLFHFSKQLFEFAGFFFQWRLTIFLLFVIQRSGNIYFNSRNLSCTSQPPWSQRTYESAMILIWEKTEFLNLLLALSNSLLDSTQLHHEEQQRQRTLPHYRQLQ